MIKTEVFVFWKKTRIIQVPEVDKTDSFQIVPLKIVFGETWGAVRKMYAGWAICKQKQQAETEIRLLFADSIN